MPTEPNAPIELSEAKRAAILKLVTDELTKAVKAALDSGVSPTDLAAHLEARSAELKKQV